VKGKPLVRQLSLASADTEILPRAIQEFASMLKEALSGRARPQERLTPESNMAPASAGPRK
jgi:hypothetical protein